MGLDNQISIPAPNKSNLERGASLRDAKARILRNVFSNWGVYIVNVAVAFLIAPLLVHRLGNSLYGVWVLVQQLVGYMGLADFSVRIAVTRYIAHHHALEDQDQINRIISTGCAFLTAIAALILACGVVIAHYFPRLFGILPQFASEARVAFLLTVIGLAISFPGALFNASLASLSRYDFLAIRSTTYVVLRATLIWFLLTHGFGLISVAAVSLLSLVVAYAMDFIFAHMELPGLQLRATFLDWLALRNLLRFSFYASLVSLSSRLLYFTDSIVVGFYLGAVPVAFYSVGATLVDYLRSGLASTTYLYGPMATQLHALDKKEGLQQLFVSGSRLAALVALPGAATFFTVGPIFLSLWMGRDYALRSGPVLIVLTVTTLFMPLSGTCGHVFYALDRAQVNAWLGVGEAVANLTLSVFLCSRIGMLGVAWGTVIPAFIFQGIAFPFYTAMTLGVSPYQYYGQALWRPLVVSVPYAFFLWLCCSLSLVQTWSSLILVVLIGLSLHGVLLWRLGLKDAERDFTRSRLRRIRDSLFPP